MPVPRRVLNAFTADEVRKHTGISIHMINYLVRVGFLIPAYGHGTRGSVRYYSYRDLVVGRIVQRLRESGVQITKLKRGLQKLTSTDDWLPASDRIRALRLLVTDGKQIFMKTPNGFLQELNGQQSFSFVVDIESVKCEIRNSIPPDKLRYFTMKTLKLEFEDNKKVAAKRAQARLRRTRT